MGIIPIAVSFKKNHHIHDPVKSPSFWRLLDVALKDSPPPRRQSVRMLRAICGR